MTDEIEGNGGTGPLPTAVRRVENSVTTELVELDARLANAYASLNTTLTDVLTRLGQLQAAMDAPTVAAAFPQDSGYRADVAATQASVLEFVALLQQAPARYRPAGIA